MSPYFPTAWQRLLADLISTGAGAAPRGAATCELLSKQLVVDMRRPVLTVPARKLSYRFMAAEAFWILSGDDRVATIAPYNPNISQFSDDGNRFFGAYGPPIRQQLPYVIEKLLADRSSRQAGLTIWRPSPPVTRDVPCTVAVFFHARDNNLHAHVFMRSSDAWLGVPYDVFNFSMLAHLMCAELHKRGLSLLPGNLHLTMASSHLYARDQEAARAAIEAPMLLQAPAPPELHQDPHALMTRLEALRETKPLDPLRWWEQPS